MPAFWMPAFGVPAGPSATGQDRTRNLATRPPLAPADQRRLTSWRRRLERRHPVRDLELTVRGAAHRYVLAAPADPDRILDELADALARAAPNPNDEGPPAERPAPAGTSTTGAAVPPPAHMPYWATPWASGLALAEVALARREHLFGRRVAELGCGLGTTATAALEAGASLLAVDCFPEALVYCLLNTLRNVGRTPHTLLADWRTSAGRRRLRDAGPFDVVLAADVLYEPEDVAPLVALIPDLLTPAGTCWLAEPGRATSERFVAAVHAAAWRTTCLEFDRDWPAGAGYARVRVHTLRPPEGEG
jgi:SAM-dependent methyltransferase